MDDTNDNGGDGGDGVDEGDDGGDGVDEGNDEDDGDIVEQWFSTRVHMVPRGPCNKIINRVSMTVL